MHLPDGVVYSFPSLCFVWINLDGFAPPGAPFALELSSLALLGRGLDRYLSPPSSALQPEPWPRSEQYNSPFNHKKFNSPLPWKHVNSNVVHPFIWSGMLLVIYL